MIRDDLINLGLEEKEAKLYVALLELGEANILEIGKKAGINRTSVYAILESLKNKGFIGITKIRKRKLYFAQDPRKIKDDIKEKMSTAERVIPQLLAITNLLDKKPSIRYFEGMDGIKEVFRDTLNYPGQEIVMWWPYRLNFGPIDEKFFSDYYVPQRLEKKIWTRSIAPDNELNRGYKKQGGSLRSLRLANFHAFSEIEIMIYGKKTISIVSFEEKFGLIIESAKIHDTLKGIFEFMWASLPE